MKNAGLAGQDDPEYYTLRRDNADDWSAHAVIVLETTLPVSVVAPWIRTQIAQIDSTAPAEIETLTQTVNRLADRPRFETALLGFFALCGLLMAVIGLYGVISFVAAQRTQEIGLRLALGAGKKGVTLLILREASLLALTGLGIGLAGAVLVGRTMRTTLYGVASMDVSVLCGVALALFLTALLASYLPARRAASIDPMKALRTE